MQTPPPVASPPSRASGPLTASARGRLARSSLLALSLALVPIAARAQIEMEVDRPTVEIDLDVPEYPELAPVPDSPVYYDPRGGANYFFYDGLYWVYRGDNWYLSSWYNGPWYYQGPEAVPFYVLRVPVQYYRQPPIYFREWRGDAPPRWGDHWGREWEVRRSGWDRWDRDSVPRAAPLPRYQRHYSGDRYPRAVEQRAIRAERYRYQPREAVTQRQFERRPVVSPRPERGPATQPDGRPGARPGERQQQPPRPTERPTERQPQRRPERQPERQPQQREPERQPQREPEREQQRPVERPHAQPQPQTRPAQPAPQGHERGEEHR